MRSPLRIVHLLFLFHPRGSKVSREALFNPETLVPLMRLVRPSENQIGVDKPPRSRNAYEESGRFHFYIHSPTYDNHVLVSQMVHWFPREGRRGVPHDNVIRDRSSSHQRQLPSNSTTVRITPWHIHACHTHTSAYHISSSA